jgi:hypothetical protein
MALSVVKQPLSPLYSCFFFPPAAVLWRQDYRTSSCRHGAIKGQVVASYKSPTAGEEAQVDHERLPLPRRSESADRCPV